jgi:uncharacterized metal-binding protein
MCASNALRQKGITPTYEIVVAKEGVDKLPTLDFSDEDVARIAEKIVNEFLSRFKE